MDTNWFNSTIAQSTAGLIGLLGGILINKMIDRQNVLTDKKIYLEQELFTCYSHFLSFSNIERLPDDVDESTKTILTKVNDLIKNCDHYSTYELYKKFIADYKLIVNSGRVDLRWNSLRTQDILSLERASKIYEKYDKDASAVSYYVAFSILAFLALIGIIVPISKLEGFGCTTFILFVLGIVLLFIWFFSEIIGFKKRVRVKNFNQE